MNRLFTYAECGGRKAPCRLRVSLGQPALINYSTLNPPISGGTGEGVQDLDNLRGNVRIVSKIVACGEELGPEILGCTDVGSGKFLVVNGLTAGQASAVWAHEFLHGLGVPDRGKGENPLPEERCALMNVRDEVCSRWCIAVPECRIGLDYKAPR